MFKRGFDFYIKGDWQLSREILGNISEVKGSPDYPSKNLLDVMAETNFVAPKDWEGFRALTEK